MTAAISANTTVTHTAKVHATSVAYTTKTRKGHVANMASKTWQAADEDDEDWDGEWLPVEEKGEKEGEEEEKKDDSEWENCSE